MTMTRPTGAVTVSCSPDRGEFGAKGFEERVREYEVRCGRRRTMQT
jgi:hypothetical protein